jgi:hypothetical protein
MDAGYRRDTAVLAFVAICLAVLVGCVGATRLSMDLVFYGEPSLGDLVTIPPTTTQPAWTAKAFLPSGSMCEIKVGATEGGELFVVTRDSSGEIGAIWTSHDQHPAPASQCRDGARITLDAPTFATLEAASRGVGSVPIADFSGAI